MTVSANSDSNFSAWLRDHVIVASLIVMLCSLFPRVLIAWRADPADLVKKIYLDAGTYLAPARSLIKQGAFLNSAGQPNVHRTPGYPTFLAGVMSVVGGDLHRVLIFQALILSGQVLALYWLARRLLPPAMAFVGGILAAFSPWGAVLAAIPMTEGLFLLSLTLLFLAIKLTETSRSPAMIILGGSCVGLLTAAAVLVRPIWPLVILIAGALVLRYGPTRKGVWLLLAVMLACSVTPLVLWKERNRREGQFNGLSDITGQNVWAYLAWRVKAQATGRDYRVRDESFARLNLGPSQLPAQAAYDEHWRRAKAVFREHPVLTAYCFIRSAAEHALHPSPGVLRPARLNFFGDFVVFALLWGGLLCMAGLGCYYMTKPQPDIAMIDRGFLLMMLVICGLLTLSTGVSFGSIARYRAPLDLIVPLLASVGILGQVRRRAPSEVGLPGTHIPSAS
jgi:4-amino-4-deoxy-L-arabinose transferase-like glycosyltransferase